MKWTTEKHNHLSIAVLAFVFALVIDGGGSAYAQAMKLTATDYVEIWNLFSAYSYAVDTGDGPARVASFTKDGTMSSPLSHHHPYSMEQLLKNTDSYGQRERPGVQRHMLFNIHITPTPTGADGFAYALFPVGEPEADSSIKVKPGFYRVTLVKTDNGWRFRTMEVFYDNADIPPTTSRGSIEGTLTGGQPLGGQRP